MNIAHALNALTQLGATWILWCLLLLSFVAISIIVERSLVFLLTRADPEQLQKQMRSLLDVGDVEAARHQLEQSRSYEARVAAAGLLAGAAGSAEERMLGETQLVRLEMESRLMYLGTLGNNAPFVGLLGTVIGIIGAFHQLGNGAGQVSSGLMAQIGEALVATAIGLLVALPAVAAYNLFHRIISSRLARAEVLTHDVLAYFKACDESTRVSQRSAAAE
jgi:biopolymer transport protein ExbB